MTTKSTKPSTSYCWIRGLHIDGGFHRVGCIAFKRSKGKIYLASSLSTVEDYKGNPKISKRLAIRRLDFKTKRHVITSTMNYDDIMKLCLPNSTIKKHFPNRFYDKGKLAQAIDGAIKDII